MTYSTLGVSAYGYTSVSSRDLFPRLGLSLSGRYSYTPFDKEQIGNIWYIKGRLYLPGLVMHHSFQLSAAYQEQNVRKYPFVSKLAFPRGFEKAATLNLMVLSADYAFPIAYPDVDLGFLFYLKRIRGNIWGDYGKNSYRTPESFLSKSTSIKQKMSSTGFDLTADFHLFRILFPFNAGVRAVYFPKSKNIIYQPIFQINYSF